MTGLNHEAFEKELTGAAHDVLTAENSVALQRANLQRIARAAHAAGMTERQIAKVTGRSGPAVHAWLHKRNADG